MEEVSFKTSDGVTIYANSFSVVKPKKYLILLHMMPAVKESWDDFAQKLNEAGMSVLAIDLRGHGESTEDGKLDYNSFFDEEHQRYRLDVEAAISFLKEKGVTLEDIYLGGASIGANLTIDFMGRYNDIKKGFALSPGLNYKGIETLPLVITFHREQALFIVGASDDQRSGGPADQMAQEIFDKTSGKKQIKIFETGGHGTTILENHPELMDELITWLKN